MLREAALGLGRPILVVTALAREAEALASEVGFFLDEAPESDPFARRVHLLPAWELKPFAHLSPPPHTQAAQLAALYAALRGEAPMLVASAEALLMRTLPRPVFESSVMRIAAADTLDLEALIDALSAAGYQRVPQTEEPGDFSVRGGIIDIFSPLYHNPVRIELEEDIVTSVRQFDPASQRSLGETRDAIVIRTRLVPPIALKDDKVRERVALRASEIGLVRKELAELSDSLTNGLLFPGAELLTPLLFGRPLDTVFSYLPSGTVVWIVEPGRVLAEAIRVTEQTAAAAEAAQSKPSFYPPPESLYLSADEFEDALGAMTAVEVGSLVTVAAPREGWAPRDRGQVPAEPQARRERPYRATHAAELRAARHGIARGAARTGPRADGGRRRQPGRASPPSSGGLRPHGQHRVQELRRTDGVARLSPRDHGGRNLIRRGAASRRALRIQRRGHLRRAARATDARGRSPRARCSISRS